MHNVSNIRRTDVDGSDAVTFVLSTKRGSIELTEWLNGDRIERTDSNIRHNRIDEVAALFDMSDKPGLMPSADWLPLSEIFDAVDAELETA